MAFTLTDPRMQAISQAAGNFGTGMGNAINQYVNNQIFANALQQAQGQDPLAMLQTLARSNVDPASRELAMSPQVQQRLQGQTLAKILGDAYQKYQSGQGTLQDVIQAGLQAGIMTGNTEFLPKYLSFLAERSWSEDGAPVTAETPRQTPTEAPNGVRAPRGNAQETKQPQPIESKQGGFVNQTYEGIGKNLFPGVQFAARRSTPEQQIPFAPKTQLPSPEEKLATRKQFVRQYGADLGNKLYDTWENAQREQRAVEKENLQLAKEERKEQMELNDKDRAAFDAYWNKTFATRPEMNEDIKLAAQDYLINHTDGTIEKRTLQTQNEFLNKIEAPLQTFEKNIKGAPIFASLNSPEKMQYLSELNGLSDQVLKAVPKYFRPQMYDIMRKKLRNISGVGPVSAEIALFPPSDQMIQLFRNLPKKQSTPATAWFDDEKALKTDERAKIKLQKLLPTVIKKAVNGGLSPIVAKNLVIAQGWDDADFDAAYKKAKKMGMKISPEMQTADKDVYRQQKPGAMDYIRGNPLLELTEIYQ